MQGMLVGGTGTPLMAGNFGLEVIVVGFFSQSGEYLGPHRLGNKDAMGVVGPGELLYFAPAEQIGEVLFQCFEMSSESGANHDAVRIEWLAVIAATLPRAYRTEETVFGKYPHRLSFGRYAKPHRLRP